MQAQYKYSAEQAILILFKVIVDTIQLVQKQEKTKIVRACKGTETPIQICEILNLTYL